MKTTTARPSQQVRSVHVLVRFAMRILMLALFSAFIGASFGYAMLLVSVFLSIVCGLVKREHPLGGALTHWDEAAAYAAMFCAVSIIRFSGAA